MTLQVPLEQFLPTLRRLFGAGQAFIGPNGKGSLVTAADPTRNLLLISRSLDTVEHTREALRVQGVEVLDGLWSAGDASGEGVGSPDPFYVVAVSYKSEGESPGVWVDAYPEMPTQVMALRNLYEEFRGTGETADVSFEEFVRLANPNVVIVSPDEIAGYLRQKEDSME